MEYDKIMPQRELFFEGEFTSMNEYIEAERINRYEAAKIKEVETGRVRYDANGVQPVESYPLDVTFIWIRKDRRSDPGNIAFGEKFIMDGLQSAGVIKADGWNQIRSISHKFELDKDNPGVVVSLVWDDPQKTKTARHEQAVFKLAARDTGTEAANLGIRETDHA